ncbi:hypothetical protein GCM10010503_14890 [Streptomyces lucensis JCM 4490]|uniref:Uncharacterized protein n=1 Tax=Streptomyces lucensis JCM 4490 TaxID=1306176 RepID=A0A918IZY3_9ACTN|nr:hypothetical protein GCM10010503_14890 [Streptomyces lucensis JCM 4490]
MIGGFATWRNIPITFDQADTGSATVQVANYLRVTPNTSSSPVGPNIEIGLYAKEDGEDHPQLRAALVRADHQWRPYEGHHGRGPPGTSRTSVTTLT